jgi:hypothetical protein
MLAEGMTIEHSAPSPEPPRPAAPAPARQESALAARMRQSEPARNAPQQTRPAARKESFGGSASSEAAAGSDVQGAALKSLRDRLIQRQQR